MMKKYFLWIKKYLVTKKPERSKYQGNLSELEQKLGYIFTNKDILHLGLVHRSYLTVTGGRQSNERLEFLGDAILGFLVTEYLFRSYPRKSEGVLTEYKSAIVSRKSLARLASQIQLGAYLYMGQGEERSGGRKRPSIISNAFEAVLGAVYVDGGYQATKRVVERLILVNSKEILQRELHRNFKSQLLEYTQAQGWGLPQYEVKTEKGPEHDKVFEVMVRVHGKVAGVGTGKSKKKAEQKAAQKALEIVN